MICGRDGRGFGYCHLLHWDRYPFYQFCSMRCLRIGEAVAKRNLGVIVIDKSAREREAIKATRRSLAETLTRLGLMEPFFHRSAEDIDAIIEACVDGFQASLTQQAKELSRVLDDEIPF